MSQHFIDPAWIINAGRELYLSGGLPRGSSTGWRCVDELYTVSPGQWTVVTGMPQSGKSEFVDAMLINLAADSGWHFTVFSPENHPTETHLVKLVEKRVGKPFGPGPTPRMTVAEYDAGAAWVCERIRFLHPKSQDFSPENLMATAVAHRRIGVPFGVVLDPWNTMDHDRHGMTETDYISWMLGHVVRMVREFHVHCWLVVHPAKIFKNKDGSIPVPRPYDISGSAHWYNKSDNIITVHRDQTDPDSDEVQIHVQKVRHKANGHLGLATLRYRKTTGTYVDVPYIRDVMTGKAERYA